MVLATHFSCADNLDNDFTKQQLSHFKTVLNSIDKPNLLKSLANSAAILDWPEVKDDWQRPGYMLYGKYAFHAQPYQC